MYIKVCPYAFTVRSAKWFLSFHCRVPVGTLSGLQCSGVVTWMQVLTTKPISPGCRYTPTTEVSMWRYCTNIWPEHAQIYLILDHVSPCQSFSSRSRRKMKVLFWLSTVSWTFCVSQNSPFTVAGSATSMLMPVSSLTSESWMGLTRLS